MYAEKIYHKLQITLIVFQIYKFINIIFQKKY